jgi:hypothetical protein
MSSLSLISYDRFHFILGWKVKVIDFNFTGYLSEGGVIAGKKFKYFFRLNNDDLTQTIYESQSCQCPPDSAMTNAFHLQIQTLYLPLYPALSCALLKYLTSIAI